MILGSSINKTQYVNSLIQNYSIPIGNDKIVRFEELTARRQIKYGMLAYQYTNLSPNHSLLCPDKLTFRNPSILKAITALPGISNSLC
jgi:hypothetical protein